MPTAAASGVTALAAGAGHTVALKNDGRVVAWGDRNFGQTTVPASAQGSVIAIAAGDWHTVALIASVPLTVTLHGQDELILSWPDFPSGFILQSTPALTPPVNWSNVNAPPTLLNAQFTVTAPLSDDARFFRLWKP